MKCKVEVTVNLDMVKTDIILEYALKILTSSKNNWDDYVRKFPKKTKTIAYKNHLKRINDFKKVLSE